MFEETGIKADELIFEFTEISEEKQTIYNLYLCFTNCDKTGITLQDGETIAFKWLSYDELKTSLNEFPELYCACTADRLRQCDLFKDIEL